MFIVLASTAKLYARAHSGHLSESRNVVVWINVTKSQVLSLKQ